MELRRILEVTVGVGKDTIDAVLLSDLDISGKVDRTIFFEPSTAELKVFNAQKSTRNMLEQPGSHVMVKAGYAGGPLGMIFSGVVAKASSSHAGADWTTTIAATNSRAIGAALEAVTVNLSYTRGTQLGVIISEVATLLGMVALGLENISDLSLTGNFVYSGGVRGALRLLRQILAANQRGFFADNNELVCFRVGVPSEFTNPYLSYDSGLLTVKKVLSADEQADAINAKEKKQKITAEQLRQRIELTCILLPQVRPNANVTVESEAVKGSYLVEKLSYTFDNMGKDWTMTVGASAS